MSYQDELEWKVRGICASSMTPDAWYAKGASGKELCKGCPVMGECLSYALEHKEKWGVWGGLTPTQRRIWLRRYNKFLLTIETLKMGQSQDDAEAPIAS